MSKLMSHCESGSTKAPSSRVGAGAPPSHQVQLLDRSGARLSKWRCRNKEALFHDPLSLTKAALDLVAWLATKRWRHEARHPVNAADRLVESLINQGSAPFREDANLYPNELTNLKPIRDHAERTSIP